MGLFLTILLLIIALLPAVVLLLLVYFSDKIEREPFGLIMGLIGMGVLSTLPAIIWESIGSLFIEFIFPDPSTNIVAIFIDNFLLVAVAEETCKFLCMFIITWKNKAFDYSFDGVVYAVATSLGFAGLENILYIFTQATGNTEISQYLGFAAGASLGLVRAFLAVPLHTSVAIFMGFFYGRAKESVFKHELAKGWLNILLALLIPMLIHGFYDFLLSVGSVFSILVFVLFVIALYVLTIIMNHYFSKNDHNITGRLKEKVTPDGWLRYAITDQREVMIMGLTRPFQGDILMIPEEIEGYPVRIISRAAFAYTNIVNVQLPNSIRIIEDTAFFNCPYLTNVILPDQLQSIGNFAFEYCYNIRTFLIPHIKVIGNHVFDGCNLLTDIYYLGNAMEWQTVNININENSKLLDVRFYYNANRQ